MCLTQVRRFKRAAWAALWPLAWKEKGKEQTLMTGACRNMKKIVLHPATMSWVKESLFQF
ncbi:hypothetical protein JF544_03040 [Halobacillus kuroshimensis]|uniref:Uncharacterized protein n=1 Tax=Halobacillus kuroshimensis TaxID=302481 RepID=A0ABS3DSC4_9BACI|nr:hypothetical protein [Halobacillus kuroshimensis]